MNECTEAKSIAPTIPGIDSELSSIRNRLRIANDNLRAGVFGETPNDECKDAKEMPTPSLASIIRRIDDIFSEVNNIEIHVAKIHQSNKVGS